MNRREFVRSVVAAIAALSTPACHRRSESRESPLADSTLWNLIRDALKSLEASPDHLEAQSAKVVATGDPARIAAWVRDHITVLPPVAPTYAPTTALWGPRATMRSGAGSARDRADLLAGLLEAAGYKTRVVAWKRPASLTQDVLYRVHDLAFEPDMHLLAPLLEHAKLPKLQAGPDQDSAKECHRLTDALLALADEQLLAHARPIDAALPDTLPIVEYERGGAKGWAIAYGSSDVATSSPDGLGGVAGDADVRDVKLSVSVAVNPAAHSTLDRTVPHEVLSAKWPVKTVAGRQVLIGFAPPKNPRPYLLGGVDPRTEVQRVAVARLLASEAVPPSEGAVLVQGERFSLAGLVGSPPEKGSTDRNAGSANVQRRKTVTDIALRASAAAFPTVTLDVSLSDARAQAVDGLAEPDFTVTEDGKAQTISVVRNTVPEGIRVLVVVDTSGSILNSWGSAQKRAAFEAQLAKQLTDVGAKSPYLLQIIGLSDTPNMSAWSAPNTDQTKSRLAGIGSLSDVWWSLGEAAPKSGASAVIVLSDFASGGEDVKKIPDYQRHLKASGIPLAILPIGKVDRAATKLIHDLSGCEEIAQDDPMAVAKLGAFVEKQVKQASTVNYQLQYRAPEGGAAKRTVEVTVKDAPAHAARAEYAVPAATERVAATGIAGVYLTIEMPGRPSVTRTLAGLPLSYRGTVGDTADQRAIDEATHALNGLHTVAFEPTQPTTSAILHEGLTRLLTIEPIVKAGKRPFKELLPQLMKVQRFEPTLGLLLEAVPDGDDLGGAVPDGLRVMVISDTPSGKSARRTIDLISEFNTWHGRSADPKQAFRAAFRRSLASSVREGRLFQHSAAGELGKGPWVWLPPSDDGSKLASLSAVSKAWLRTFSDRYSDKIRVVGTQQASGGGWIIDPSSGSVTAVDADGRGGAGCEIPDKALLLVALILISAACTFEGAEATSGGWVLCAGADAFGAGVTAKESFKNPVDDAAVGGAYVAAALYGLQLGATAMGPAGAWGRGLAAVILAMLTAISTFCPGEGGDGVPSTWDDSNF